MKKVLFLLIFLLSIASAGAQVLSLQWDEESIADGSTVVVNGELSDNVYEEFLSHVLVKNETDRDMQVKARRANVDVVDGSTNFLCWQACYPDDVTESPNSYTIPAGGMTPETVFAGHYQPHGNAGVSTVKYTFFNELNEDEQVSFFVEYNIAGHVSTSLSLHWDGQDIANGATVFVDGEMTDNIHEEFLSHVLVKNNSDRDMQVKARREDIDVVAGSTNYLCWQACYPDDVTESPNAYTIPAGETTPETVFAGHYIPRGNAGTSTIKYTFFNESQSDDQVYFLVSYVISPTSLDDLLSKALISSAYPNPATDQFAIDYEFPSGVEMAEVKLFNIVGQEILKQAVSGKSGKIQLSVSDLPEGIYFYSLTINDGATLTKKLVVRR
jgi:urease beta subunit